MKKALILISMLLHFGFSYAQTNDGNFDFSTNPFDAVDKWVVLPMNRTDSTYLYGFIYFDQQAGFTFHVESQFKVADGKIARSADDNMDILRARMGRNFTFVSVLSDQMRMELELPLEPEWLGIYKSDEGSMDYLKQLGFYYNHVGDSDKALGPLYQAYETEPHYKDLERELAYAHNVLGEYEKAVSI